jgi:exosortase B
MSRSGELAQAGMRLPVEPGNELGPIARLDRGLLGLLVAGFLLLYLPAVWDWARGPWESELQGHELVMLFASGWLLYRQRDALARLPDASSPTLGNLLMAAGLAIYFVGRSQQILSYEFLSLTVLIAALLLRYKGLAALRVAWFPLVFQLFARPLPYDFVMAVTAPLKMSVSAVATWLLSVVGYPVGRSGVVMTVGQYQLLVTEACAGLQTMFTLEAMGLLYASLMHHGSKLRNALLAVLVVPVSFAANVIRVMALAMVTFHFGDAAGQGFLHEFAGIVLFLVALIFLSIVDRGLGMVLPTRPRS